MSETETETAGAEGPADAQSDGPRDKYEGLGLSISRQFGDWLAGTGGSLAFTTYQAGRLFLIGTNADRRTAMFERFFNRAMGLAVADGGQSLYLASLYQLWRFTNALGPNDSYGEGEKRYDRLYVPRIGWTTGDVDIHDIGIGADGRPIFINTLFSCLARASDSHSFEPVWKPPFVSRLAAEDRCHLNGLAMEDGEPRFVTAVGTTDVADGWREHRRDGGVVVDVASGEIVCTGLSMPHSPRLHDGRLYLHNSGTGEFGTVDLASGKFEPICFCPGYLRGLTFVAGHAVVGLSKPRDGSFGGLLLSERLEQAKVGARCGLAVIDLKSGDAVHRLEFETQIEELYDVAVLPGAKKPSVLGFRTDEIRRMLSIPPGSEL